MLAIVKGVHLGNPRGQALVELALTLSLLFLIVFGITEFGRAMYITSTLNNAARDGARRAVVMAAPLNKETITAGIQKCAAQLIPPLDSKDISVDPASPTANAPVTVTVQYPFQPLMPLMDKFFPPGFKLKGAATMRYEL